MTRSPTTALKLLTLPLAVLAFSGCATTQVSPESRLSYDNTQQALQQQPVSIVSDACILRVEMGKDDILYQQSDAASTAMMLSVAEALNEQGVDVTTTVTPFVCGSLNKDDLTSLDILISPEAKDEINTTYPLLSTNNTFDVETNQVYLNLLGALDSETLKKSRDAKGTSVPLNLDDNSVALLRQLLDTDVVFVSLVQGSMYSFGSKMAMGVATAVATGGTSATMLQDGQRHGLYLINLKDSTIEWGKKAPFYGQVFKMPVNERFTYEGMLAPLYEDD